MLDEENTLKGYRKRANRFYPLIMLMLSFIVARLWYLQISKGEQLNNYSVQNRIRQEITRAPRGLFYDRNKKILAHNVPRYDAIITPQYLTNKKDTFKKLSQILKIDLHEIEDLIRKNSHHARYHPITLKENISYEEIVKIETQVNQLSGVSVEVFKQRAYPYKEVGSHLIGYISTVSEKQLEKSQEKEQVDYSFGDYIGQFGIEKHYDLEVRGQNGFEYVGVNARGVKTNDIFTDNLFRGLESSPLKPGKSLTLTIDQNLQEILYQALDNNEGAAALIDIKSGEILAMISKPGFDPNQFAQGLTHKYWKEISTDTRRPLRDRVIQDHFSPGSTFKPFTAFAALETGVINARSTLNCKGTYRYGGRTYHCWNRHGHGTVNVIKALRESCNVFFYKLAHRLNIDTLAKYAKMFGLGSPTGVGLNREVSGLVPTKSWKLKKLKKKWKKGETLSCAIGQSYTLVSVLQLAKAYAIIAAKGHSPQTHLIQNSEKIKPPSKLPIKAQHFSLVKKGLYQVINSRMGTAHEIKENFGIAGKTGTVQVIGSSKKNLFRKCESKPYKYRHHALFAGYAPLPDPEVAIAVLIEHGCRSIAAAKVAKDILKQYMNYKKFSKLAGR